MIQVRDNRGNYHEALAIYDNAGREIKEVRNNQGRLLFKNWNEIQGSPPITFRGYGKNLTECRIYGNTVQNGTPSSENPVEVQGCGEYDAELNGYKIPVTVSGVNLFDYNWIWTNEHVVLNDYFNCITIVMKPNTEYTISNNYRVLKSPALIETALIVVNSETEITIANGGVDRVRTVTTASDGLLRIAYRTRIDKVNYQDIVVNRDTLADGTYYIQINEGSSASPYEPYHEPITTPVYIGSEPLHKIGDYADYVDFKRGVVVRRIKKLVLTGEESWYSNHLSVNLFNIGIADYVKNTNATICLCTHYKAQKNIVLWANVQDKSVCFYDTTSDLYYLRDSDFSTVVDFKSYLAAQYEAGTPVTVWYVLAEPEEEPLENLLPIQIIKGANILTADTTVQPSDMYIKGKIKQIT